MAGGASLPLSSEELGDSAGMNPDDGLPFHPWAPKGPGATVAEATVRVSLEAEGFRGTPWRPAAENESRAEQPFEFKASVPSGQSSVRDRAGFGPGSGEPLPTGHLSTAASAPSKNSQGLHSGTFGGGLTLETRASRPHWRPTSEPGGSRVDTAKVPHIRGRPYGRTIY